MKADIEKIELELKCAYIQSDLSKTIENKIKSEKFIVNSRSVKLRDKLVENSVVFSEESIERNDYQDQISDFKILLNNIDSKIKGNIRIYSSFFENELPYQVIHNTNKKDLKSNEISLNDGIIVKIRMYECEL